MTHQLVDPSKVKLQQRVSLSELAERSCLSEDELRELVDYGSLVPINAKASDWTFDAEVVPILRKASRLRDDLALGPHSFALAVMLLGQMRALEVELSLLRARSPQHPVARGSYEVHS
jgi:hypothetical protein